MTHPILQVSNQRFGLITLGNSGVGKSFLGNLVLGEEKFTHKSKPTSVTTTTEFEEFELGNNIFVIFNIPGLIEAKQARIDENKQQIDRAFQECANSVIMYVFGSNNGRIRNEDIVAFNALNAAYPFKPNSLVLVVNCIPSADQRDESYEGETITLLREVLDMKIFSKICFLDTVNVNNAAERRWLHDKLMPVIMSSMPSQHVKRQDIHLQRDELMLLINKLADMISRFEQERERLWAEFNAAQRQHQVEMDRQRQAFQQLQAQMTAKQSEIDNLRQTVTRQPQTKKKGCVLL